MIRISKKLSLAGTALLASLAFSTTLMAKMSADDILKKADDIRNPSESFRMLVKVKNSDGETSKFEVSTLGKDKSLIKTLEPARDVGRNMLMLEENMWVFIPNLNRSVRVSLNQKLTGEAANGDISRTRWHGDYNTKIAKQTDKAYVLFLDAKKKGLTYDKIRVWIDKKSYRPIKAEYLSLGGKTLKKAAFRAYKKIAGGMRPTEVLIKDATRTKKTSLIKILELEKKSYPASMFNQTNLK